MLFHTQNVHMYLQVRCILCSYLSRMCLHVHISHVCVDMFVSIMYVFTCLYLSSICLHVHISHVCVDMFVSIMYVFTCSYLSCMCA